MHGILRHALHTSVLQIPGTLSRNRISCQLRAADLAISSHGFHCDKSPNLEDKLHQLNEDKYDGLILIQALGVKMKERVL